MYEPEETFAEHMAWLEREEARQYAEFLDENGMIDSPAARMAWDDHVDTMIAYEEMRAEGMDVSDIWRKLQGNR